MFKHDVLLFPSMAVNSVRGWSVGRAELGVALRYGGHLLDLNLMYHWLLVT